MYWIFEAYKTPAHEHPFIWARFDDHVEMKEFSAKLSKHFAEMYPHFVSDYHKHLEPSDRDFVNTDMEKKRKTVWGWYRAAFSRAPFTVSVVTMAIGFLAVVGVLELIERVVG